MTTSAIKQVVFDIGNVLVRWSPVEIVRLTFGQVDAPEALAKRLFGSDIWLDLNKGLLTESEAQARYQRELGLSAAECEHLFYYAKHTQILLHGSVELLTKVKAAGYGVYALTDNVHEIVAHLQSQYSFWPLFDGAIVSANLGVLKPQAEIYQALLKQYQLEASETVFLDDMPYNVEGAQAQGMHAIQFFDAQQAEQALLELGLKF